MRFLKSETQVFVLLSRMKKRIKLVEAIFKSICPVIVFLKCISKNQNLNSINFNI